MMPSPAADLTPRTPQVKSRYLSPRAPDGIQLMYGSGPEILSPGSPTPIPAVKRAPEVLQSSPPVLSESSSDDMFVELEMETLRESLVSIQSQVQGALKVLDQLELRHRKRSRPTAEEPSTPQTPSRPAKYARS